jgi:acetate---CoA ligase (ADP-forming) subunit beta
MNEIKTAIELGHKALSEFQSKKLLRSYGIPVTREALAESRDSAVSSSEEIGYPVVMKACSHELMHKSEKDGIRLNLKNRDEVMEAYDHIMNSVDIKLEGVLVQEMVSGQRELVMGMSRDLQFGPCVMLGIGGIMTEIINDTVFRVAPFDHREALDMIEELRLNKMLGDFRGQAPADVEAISNSLMTIGKIGMKINEISEIDVNPLIVDRQGRITAVDALVVL